MNKKFTIRDEFFVTSARFVFGFSMLALFAFCAAAEAQEKKFDLEEYLRKVDVNRNGTLEGKELSDRTKGWIAKLGIATDKPVSIKKVVAKVAQDRKNAANKKTSAGRTRQVPSFGVEDTESATVVRFATSSSSSTSASGSTKSKLSDSIIERVNSTLERYDRNKDGMLDRSEISRARWGSPSPEQSDTNRDGKLSRKELAIRYASREQYYRSSSSSSSSGRDMTKEQKREAEERARRERERERFRTSGSSGSTRYSYSSGSSQSGSSVNVASSAVSQAKYEKYAESLIGNYDKNKDGKLNKDEVKAMRRPPVGADSNKDGYITKSELLDSLSGTNRTTSTTSSAKSESPSANSSSKYAGSSSSSGSSRSSSSRYGSSSDFERLDANEDRNVQMHEFSDEWDDETIAKFYEKDKNGDGVITLREWAIRN